MEICYWKPDLEKVMGTNVTKHYKAKEYRRWWNNAADSVIHIFMIANEFINQIYIAIQQNGHNF